MRNDKPILPIVLGSTTASCVSIYRMSQEECASLREGVPYGKVYRYNPKHLCAKLNGYGDTEIIELEFCKQSCSSTRDT
jgi:hypothetical protein